MSEKPKLAYAIDGYEVVFVPWHSVNVHEDFMAVYVTEDGREVCHAGTTKLVPSEGQAREFLRTMLLLREGE